MFEIVNAILGLVIFVIQVLIVKYLINLEKIGCECAENWRRKFIIFYLIFVLAYSVIIILVPQTLPPIIQFVLLSLGVANIIITIQYVYKLKKDKCECSESIMREILYFIAIFNALLFILLVVLSILLIFNLVSYAKYSKNNLIKNKMNVRVIEPKKK